MAAVSARISDFFDSPSATVFSVPGFKQGRRAGVTRRINRVNGRTVAVYAACRSSRPAYYSCGYDLYELFGVERDASQQEIRRSYRWLQKKCHPDIAGTMGHEMSILLNRAYTTLADPHERAAYDQTLVEELEVEGYTGYPLYSTWYGPESEDRAVFVDENQCVGCLKCALIARNTFAIENMHGRARAVGQWADPAPVIEDAIKSCPVDCIWWIDRSQLAAFEFVMSKEPRLPLRAEMSNSGGIRTVDVHKAAECLLKKLKKREVANSSKLKETGEQKEARLAAAAEVQLRAGRWWYRFFGKSDSGEDTKTSQGRKMHGALVPLAYYRTTGAGGFAEEYGATNRDDDHGSQSGGLTEELRKLYEVASGRRSAHPQMSVNAVTKDEYWVPLSCPDCSGTTTCIELGTEVPRETAMKSLTAVTPRGRVNAWEQLVSLIIPCTASGIAGLYVAFTAEVQNLRGDAQEQVGGGLIPADWLGSKEMQIVSAAVFWYVVGVAVARLATVVGKLVLDGISSNTK